MPDLRGDYANGVRILFGSTTLGGFLSWFAQAKHDMRASDCKSRSGHCHVWTPPVLQGENRFETAVELAVMYPAFSLRYTDRWP